jgi:hypothetical protein
MPNINMKKIIFILMIMNLASLSRAATLDSSISNAVLQVIIPIGSEVVIDDISPNASDPSLLLRITAMSSNAWFDAIAPYHPTARGVYTNIANRPSSERTDENRNIAMLYASFHVYNSLMPHRLNKWKNMLRDVGLDPEDTSTNASSPVGIGNLVGKAIVGARENDGMNQLGNEGGCLYNCQPYADYTGYKPKNTAYKLRRPSRWQPDILSNNFGQYNVQKFVTAQFGNTQPYTYRNPNRFTAPVPYNSLIGNFFGYKMQANEVLSASASMTDEQKAKAELFDNKFNSVLAAAGSVAELLQLSLEEFVHIEFATNIASFDTAIAIWYNKRKYDSVRPFSAIKYIYGNNIVTAWGGAGKGTVYDLPADQWKSYLPVANHPEYPSATSSICAAHAQVMRRLHGDQNLNFSVNIPAGSSRIEPGITPQSDLTLNWTSWSDFENDCGQSRLWSGVHFSDSIPAGMDIGHQIADITYQYMRNLLEGGK